MPTTETEPDAAPSGPDAHQPGVAAPAAFPPDEIEIARGHADVRPTASAPPDDGCGDLVEDELLVEEISIDGMCGVY